MWKTLGNSLTYRFSLSLILESWSPGNTWLDIINRRLIKMRHYPNSINTFFITQSILLKWLEITLWAVSFMVDTATACYKIWIHLHTKHSIRASYVSRLLFIPAVKSLMWLVLNIHDIHNMFLFQKTSKLFKSEQTTQSPEHFRCLLCV